MIVGMDGKTKKVSRAMNPDQVKNCLQPRQMRKVQVVYYLSRGGQLEHPHFMELELPYNDELYLRDIMDRLTLLRGKGMPSLFSWSCKRSYKNGYVWNDLSENDVVCPARGVEYVLKGSELFEGCSEKYQESTSSKPPVGKHGNYEGPMMVYSQDYTALVSPKPPAVPRRLRIEAEEDVQDKARSHEFPPHVQFAQNNTTPDCKLATRDEDIGSRNFQIPCPSRETQKPCGNIQEHNQVHISESMDRRVSIPEEEQEPKNEKQEEKEGERNSTELSGGDQSPRSSSSASSEGARHVDNGSLDLHELIPAAQRKRPNKSVRFQEQKSHQTSPFNLIQLISCGSLPVKDHGVQMSPHRVSRFARAVETSEAQKYSSKSRILQTNVVNRTLEEELECMSENPRRLLEEKEYFSGSIVDQAAKAVEDEPDPTLNKCASYNAERSSKSEMAGMTPKDGDHSVDEKAKTKCIPRKKASKKQPKTEALPETLSKDLISDKDIKGSCGNGNSGRWVGIYRFSGHPCIGFT